MRSRTFTIICQLFFTTVFVFLISTQAHAQNGAAPTPTPCSPAFTGFYSCAYKYVKPVAASDHEPPVGGGAGSTFFDIPQQFIRLERTGKLPNYNSGKVSYHKYQMIQKDTPENPDVHPYEAISEVLVLTEEARSKGEISLFEYGLRRNQSARLKLWLSTDNGTLSDEPDIIILGDEGGAILSRKKIKFKGTGKNYRKERYVRSKKNRKRVAKWQLFEVVQSEGKTIENAIAGFGANGDDMYYFYVRFYDEQTDNRGKNR